MLPIAPGFAGADCTDNNLLSFAQETPFVAEIDTKQVAFTMLEVEMKYLMLGLVVTLVLTTFMFAFMANALYVELMEWSGRGKTDHRD